VPAASPDAEAWTEAGAAGIMLSGAPEEYGGGTFAHEAVVTEESLKQEFISVPASKASWRTTSSPTATTSRNVIDLGV